MTEEDLPQGLGCCTLLIGRLFLTRSEIAPTGCNESINLVNVPLSFSLIPVLSLEKEASPNTRVQDRIEL